jgi:hypothetical protein
MYRISCPEGGLADRQEGARQAALNQTARERLASPALDDEHGRAADAVLFIGRTIIEEQYRHDQFAAQAIQRIQPRCERY